MQNRLGPALLGLCLMLLPPAALAGGSLSTEDGVYTKAQAKNGKELYEVHCGTCHDNKYFRPVLKRWNGQSLSIFYDVMSMSMPESNPGSLLDAEYLDILAYIFSRSRYPDADEPLTMDKVAAITIEDP